jgi:hypothetical protein
MSDLDPELLRKFGEEYEAKKRSFKLTRSSGIERPEVVFKKGARFYKDETTGKTMFAFKSGAGTEFIAVANDTHRDDHPTEWLAFARSQKGAKK